MIRVITNVALDSFQSVTVDVVDYPSSIPLAPEKNHYYPAEAIDAFRTAGLDVKNRCTLALLRFRRLRERGRIR